MARKLKRKRKRISTRHRKPKSITLRSFTGRVTRNPNGTVTIVGRGLKKKRKR